MRRTPKMAAALTVGTALCLTIALPCAFATDQAQAKTVSKSLTMTVGKSKTVSVKLAKKVKKATWKTSAKTVVAVKAQGKNKAKLTAKKAGKATVTAKAGTNTYTWKVTVKKAASGQNSTAGKTMKMPSIDITTATRSAYYDKNGEPTARTDATPTTKTVRIATITFPELPTNLTELKQYEALLKDKDTGKFYFYGLFAAMVKTFDGTQSVQNIWHGANQTSYDMLEYLCTCKYNASYTGYTTPGKEKYVADRDWQNFFTYMKRTPNGTDMECSYYGNVFWDNVSYTTGYKTTAPYTITVEEDPYGEFAATATTPAFERIICRGAGDNFSQPQYLRVTWSNADSRWALFSSNWIMLASSSEIKAPAISW